MKCNLCGTSMFEGLKKNNKGEFVRKHLKKFHKELLDDKCILKPKKCYKCTEERFGKIKRGLSTEQYQFVYEVSYKEAKARNKKFGVTKENLIKKYGKEEGILKWNNYVYRQRITNTFEYKKEKYGWTKEEFDEYNNSRAVTLENCIKRHGEEQGKEIFNEYCIKQKTAGVSLEHFQNKYGKVQGIKKFEEVNQSKTSLKIPINEDEDIPGILYYIRFYNEEIEFWKIGITKNNTSKRFWPGKHSNQYNLNKEVLIEKKMKSLYYDCYLTEQKILREQAHYRIGIDYNAFKTTEAFSTDILSLVQESITELSN